MDKLYFESEGQRILLWSGTARQRLNLDKNKKFRELVLRYFPELDDDGFNALTSLGV